MEEPMIRVVKCENSDEDVDEDVKELEIDFNIEPRKRYTEYVNTSTPGGPDENIAVSFIMEF